MSRACPQSVFTVAALLMFVCNCFALVPQDQRRLINGDQGRGSLSEVRTKKRALLVVSRAPIIDTQDNERAIVESVLRADPQAKRYQLAYGTISKRLNNYVNKYKSMSSATQLSDADYIIFFNVLEYHTVLNAVYPYGELFVILKGTPEGQKPPRVVWKSKKVQWAGDAIQDLLRDLKTMRGES